MFYAVAFDNSSPAFTWFSVDSIGRGDLSVNAARAAGRTDGPLALQSTEQGRFCYVVNTKDKKSQPVWEVDLKEKEMILSSRYAEGAVPPPFTLKIDEGKNFATLLGRVNQDGSIQLPAILHLPDHGSFRISSARAGSLGYGAGGNEVTITFAGATRENPLVKYRCEVVLIYPAVDGLEADARFDAFRRNWLNIFQVSPRWRMLANHAASDTCAHCYYEYADMALRTPPLAKDLHALDMVRQTLDRVINGATVYGVPGREHTYPDFSADARPSLLIAAADYVEGRPDHPWLIANYDRLKLWAEGMMATDREGTGLIEYGLSGNSGSWPPKIEYRPANWWDCIGFGHQDAYANALAYRALRGMEKLAGQCNHPGDQARFHAAANKLKAAYFKTFYNPATGVLAGWRSADGQLHDYFFPWISGIAIHYGLVPEKEANAIMDRLLAKMKEVGFTRFDLGLPGNLIPVARKDYVDLGGPRIGGGVKEDNSDGFQKYENGCATGCFAYFTLAALYDLGRIEDGDRILFPMLRAFAAGDFQGFGPNGNSKDWKAWDGTCWGSEGLLVDNYYTFLAVFDRQAALKKKPR